jgi:hypothetical protein
MSDSGSVSDSSIASVTVSLSRLVIKGERTIGTRRFSPLGSWRNLL